MSVIDMTDQWKVQPACAMVVRTYKNDGSGAMGETVNVEFKGLLSGGGSECCNAVSNPLTDGHCKSWSGVIDQEGNAWLIGCREECDEQP